MSDGVIDDSLDEIEALELQVAVLREALDLARSELAVLASYVGLPDGPWPSAGLKVTAQAHKRALAVATAALSTAQPTGWVRLADVERVFGPLVFGVQHEAPGHVTAARAWLDEVCK